jgi:hypothetical protein
VVRGSTEAVELITDPVSMEQVYYTRIGEGWLVANSVTLLLRIVGHRPIDLEATGFFLCQAWVPEIGRFARASVSSPAGQRWRWRPGEVPDVKRYFGRIAPGKLSELRERCLDRPRSPLWELVSRERFEPLTAPGRSAGERGDNIPGLYTVLTMFEYEAVPAG